MKNQIRLPRKIALRFELIFLKLSSASDWIICTKECELIKSGHTFGLLAVIHVKQKRHLVESLAIGFYI